VSAPSWIINLARDLGYPSPGDALYAALRKKALEDPRGEPYRDRIADQDALARKVEVKVKAREAAAARRGDPRRKDHVLDEYIRGLLPSQVARLKRAVDPVDLDVLEPYQVAIQDRTGIWIEPAVFVRRLAPAVEVATS
jgi:hypothetical protein